VLICEICGSLFSSFPRGTPEDVDARHKATTVRSSESGCVVERQRLSRIVITGLVPVIYVFVAAKKGVDGRHEAGHDD
jgi:hypothetical protein